MSNLTLPEVEELIDKRDWPALRQVLTAQPPPEVADLLLELEKAKKAFVFRAMPRQFSANVFSYLEPKEKDALLQELTNEETRQLLENMRPDDRTELLEEMPGQVTQRLLNVLSPSDRKEVCWLLGYPEESVGRLMTPDYVAVRPSWTVSHAMEHVRTRGKDSETINVVYVTDPSWKLIGILGLRQLILANPSQTVEEIMNPKAISLSAFEDREEAVRDMQRYDIPILPVVDSDGILLGIVTADDVLDVVEEETTEDFQKVAAVEPLDTSYGDARPLDLFKKRIVWLLALIAVSLASSGIIAAFEDTLASAIALAFFIPLLIGSGGNTGSQSATLMIRSLATGDVVLSQWGRAIAKELLVGILLGVTMGAASWLLGLFRGGFEIGLVVGLTMALIVLLTDIVGAALPYMLTRLGLDPAVASSPLIASMADAMGLLIYFTIARIILNI
ncbi:MAG: magnesium transporter [Methanotrichaceae archaeon]|nr:magnesium transporter [Methanotrichaceae archaeon]